MRLYLSWLARVRGTGILRGHFRKRQPAPRTSLLFDVISTPSCRENMEVRQTVSIAQWNLLVLCGFWAILELRKQGEGAPDGWRTLNDVAKTGE